jgi:hypothetical protein
MKVCMGEASRRKKTDDSFGRLPKNLLENSKGLVISPPMNVTGNSMQVSGGLDPQELRYSLLFWDELIWPDNNLIHIGGSPESDFLVQSGILKRPKTIFTGSGGMAELTAKIHYQTFESLDAASPGKWALATGEKSFRWNDQPLSTSQSAVVALYRAIPVPNKDVPLAEILEFKLRRKPEILRLRAEIDSFTQAVNASTDPVEALASKAFHIENACTNLLQVGKEWKFPVRIADLQCSFEILPERILIGLAGGGWTGHSFDLGSLGAMIGGAASLLKITGSLKRQSINPRPTPYEYVYSFHNEVF